MGESVVVFGAGGVLADGKDEQVALVDSVDNFLGPHGGAVDVGFIHPDAQFLFAQILHQPNHLLLVLSRVANKNVRVQGRLFAFFDSLVERFHLGVIPIFAAKETRYDSEIESLFIESFVGKSDEFIKLNLNDHAFSKIAVAG